MSQTLKLDISNISNYQKELHFPKNKDEEVGTRFSLDVDKRSQAVHIKEKMEQIPVKEGEVIYIASKKHDSLLKVAAHIQLLPIRVKEQYKNSVSISYHHNIGHNILYYGECKTDDDHFGYVDTVWLDDYEQYYVKKRKIYKRMVGSIPCLEERGTDLPGMRLVVYQPYSFSRNTRVSLPILKSSNNKITFHYNIRTKISDLIRMTVTKDGVTKEIKPNMRYLDTRGATHIPIPEFWGRYADMTEAEQNWRKGIDERTLQPRKQIIYIEDIDIASSKNPVTIGTKEVIELAGSAPAKHIFWKASLVDGGFSNYTTNKDDVYKGWNPCVKSGIKYGTSDRIEEADSEHFDLAEPYEFNWPNTPCEAGYNVYTNTFNPMEIQAVDNAVILKECGASLNVLLGDSNPFITAEDEEDYYDEKGDIIPKEAIDDLHDNSKKDKFIVHVRTLVMRKLEVFWNDKSESLKYVYTSI